MGFQQKIVVREVGVTSEPTASGFVKRSLVGTHDDNGYEQIYEFEFIKDAVSKLDVVLPGSEVTVHFNLRGREWVNPEGVSKFFPSLQGWKIDI
jgi:hypothetical protein